MTIPCSIAPVAQRRKPTYHLLGLPHSRVTREYSTDAFSQKIRLLARMLVDQGRNVILYATEGSEAPCKVVPCLMSAEFAEIYPRDHRREQYDAMNKRGWALFNARAIACINALQQPGDFLLSSYGDVHEPVTRGTGLPTIEAGIGFYGSVPKNHRIFESHAVANFTYGKENRTHPQNYDAVIPNYYDLADFPFVEEPDGDYLLFIGRLNHDKGVAIACDVAQKLGLPIKVAGQGTLDHPYNGAEHVGTVTIEERATLMGNAIATLVPSQYVEPFGGVTIESLLCGTPVITSDFGAFPETIPHGEVGFRCRMFDDYVDAARRVGEIYRWRCREYAEANFSIARVSRMYDEYLSRIEAYYATGGGAWYADRPARASDKLMRRVRA